MSFRKIGKYYWLDIRIDGKRIRRSLKTDNKFEALDRFKEKKDQLFRERRKEKEDIKFADFSKKYLEWAWSTKPASALREQQRLKRIQEFLGSLGIAYLSDITPYHIEQLKARLKEEKKFDEKKKKEIVIHRSKATVNRYLQILRGMIYKAIDWEIYKGQNPLRKVKFFREQAEKRLLTAAQVKSIFIAAQEISEKPRYPLQHIFADLIEVALNTGMRKSEILNLRWTDIIGEAARVIGKGERSRTIPLNARVRAVISRQPHHDAFIFYLPNRDRTGLFRRTVETLRRRTGIDFTFHDFRHFFTSTLLEHGIDIVTIGTILGHSRITTSLLYSHTDEERMRRAVDSLSTLTKHRGEG